MAETEDTLPHNSDTQLILQAIAGLNNRFDGLETKVDNLEAGIDKLEKKSDRFETFVNNQFEAIRRGLVDNNAAYDRLQSSIHATRSDVFGLRANVTELTEEVRQERIALK